MNRLNYYIQEKLKITKDTKLSSLYKFNHIDKDEQECFWGYNWILNDSYYEVSIQLLEWAQDNCSLTTRENTFIDKFLKDLITKEKSKSIIVKTEALNGSQNNGFYTKPKCIYDICNIIKNNNIQYIEDKYGKKIDNDEIDSIIFDLENITNGDIKKLDWPH